MHASDEQLRAYQLCRMTDEESREVEVHLTECDECATRLEAIDGEATHPDERKRRKTLVAEIECEDAFADYWPPPDVHDFLSETWDVLEFLGRGQGVVYKAARRAQDSSHPGLTVALKVITANRVDIRRAESEFRAMKCMGHHPNVVQAHACQRRGSEFVIEMEYVDGLTLAEVVEKKCGGLQVSEACGCIAQVLCGMRHAWFHRIVHRDVKPSNLMQTRSGIVKILDFGLAKVFDGPDDPHLSITKLYKGTPDFSSPEQIENSKHVDYRADLYSIGCVLYFLLSGRPPFGGGTRHSVFEGHLTQEPPPLGVDSVPDEVNQIMRTLLQKDPERRSLLKVKSGNSADDAAAVATALLPFADLHSQHLVREWLDPKPSLHGQFVGGSSTATKYRQQSDDAQFRPVTQVTNNRSGKAARVAWTVALTSIVILVAVGGLAFRSNTPGLTVTGALETPTLTSSTSPVIDLREPPVVPAKRISAGDPDVAIAVIDAIIPSRDFYRPRVPEFPGGCTKVDDELFIDPGSIVAIPWSPQRDYRLSLSVERLEGENAFILGSQVVGESKTAAFEVLFDAWPPGFFTGVWRLDGKPGAETITERGQKLRTGETHAVVVEVVDDAVRVTLDGAEMCHITQASTRLARTIHANIPADYPASEYPLYFRTAAGRFRITDAELTPKGAPASGRQVAAADRKPLYLRGQWRDQNGVLEQTAPDKPALLIFGDPGWTDGDFTCEIWHTREDVSPTLLVRALRNDLHIYAEFGGYRNTFSDLQSVSSSAWQRLGSRRIGVRVEEWVPVKVELRGKSIRTFADGIEIAQGEHERAAGAIGFRTWGGEAKFRNARFVDPAGELLWEGVPDLER